MSANIPLAKASHKTKSKISGMGEIYFTSMEMVCSHMVKCIFSGRDEELRTERQSINTTHKEKAFPETRLC